MKSSLAWVCLIAACGGSEGPSIDELPKSTADSLCKAQVACGYADSVAACEASLSLVNFQLQTIVADVKAGVIVYDADKAAACFDDVDTSCQFPGLARVADDPCASYLVGTVATGGACFYAVECADGAPCNTPPSCDPFSMCCAGGTCGTPAPTNVASGGACTSSANCTVDAYCKTGGAPTGTCAPLVAAGGACGDFDACTNPTICSSAGSNGTCYTPAPSGGTCDPDVIYLDYQCSDERDYCDSSSKLCVPRVSAGGACSELVLCAPGAACYGGVCVKYVAKGAACDQSNGPACALGSACNNGICTGEPSGMSCR
jgi:hypothetical protein